MNQPDDGILWLQGSLDSEATFDMRDICNEKCGLAATVNLGSKYVYECLLLQQSRGEKGVGIVSDKDGKFYSRKRIGKIKDQFMNFDFKNKLPGKASIGHNRYATAGAADSVNNIQPLTFESKYGTFHIAHNGTLPNIQKIQNELKQKGISFQSTTDTEVFAHTICQSSQPNIKDAIIEATQKIDKAYSMIIMTPNQIFAFRDRYGVRPLSLGECDIPNGKSGYIVVSENYVFNQYPEFNEDNIYEVKAGEMIIFNKGIPGYEKIQYAEPDEHFCVFEKMYFSNPRTKYNNYYHEDYRQELGKQIFYENPDLEADAIVPILDSGKQAAFGLSNASKNGDKEIPYKEYFMRIHDANRSFTAPSQKEREKIAYQKLNLRKEKIIGKRIVTVDDSIVRGTTQKLNNQRLREAGAKEIINVIASPVITNICNLGMDFETIKQLASWDKNIRRSKTIQEIEEEIGADKLIYLSLDGLRKVEQRVLEQLCEKNTSHNPDTGICTGCFGGDYPGKNK